MCVFDGVWKVGSCGVKKGVLSMFVNVTFGQKFLVGLSK